MNHFIKTLSSAGRRACALLLCTVMLLGMIPAMTPAATAADTQQDWSLNRLVAWDIMRGDQAGNLEPARAITRAEFVSMLNRTFGYTQTGAQPFRDVRASDWFYDDISIAYAAGYFQGTSRSTAAPNSTLTREEAATMLCRNLMLRPLSGEDLSFTDSRQASSWSRGYIKAAAEEGILRGDPEGTFRPLDNITRGEVAMMLTRVIGTPIQEPGTYSYSVSGNLMVNTSGVTLENMVITGDLYITAGVGLGYVTLNNVTVYGKIIASGSGESNRGDCSIILKNCTAPEMIVDSPTNQYVTIRSVGETEIDRVSVRTDAYLENRSTGDFGFQYIELDGEDGTQLDLAGNIHDVITITPESEINVGSGSVDELTVDEAATGSTVTIAQGAVVDIMNLDTATTVTGEGDIGTLNVNAAGCVVEMLPDIIVIRPGITANINGIVMDSTLAEQMSDTPRLLSGYPRVDDIAPTQVRATFRTNKPGTVYWAVRLSGDGGFSASDLINPPTYGANIVKSGNIRAANANEDLTAQISGLTLDTSYVLSAVLVDARDDRSIVKNIYFTTPDNSRPAFASGYPRAVTIEDTYVDFDVAATKNCTLYWAIYPSGMPAPTANDFKDGALSGAIDSGDRRVERSVEDSIRMGSSIKEDRDALEELTDYDAYFFLTDGINQSNVVRVSVTTADRTPPQFLDNFPRITGIERTSLSGECAINEDGKVYWAAVKHGADYPVENAALDDEDARELDYKLQIRGGMYALASGSFNADANEQTSFNLNRLEPETAYDIYFVAEDDSGNLSVIEVLENAKTLDSNAPTLVELQFSESNADGIPLASTDITLVFSEDIYNTLTRMSLVEMYEDVQAGTTDFPIAGSNTDETVSWEDILTSMFTLENLDTAPVEVVDYSDKIDMVTVALNQEGQTEVTFKNNSLGLQSGTRYQFVLHSVTDSSNNLMGANTRSEEFRILDAQVNFYDLGEVTLNLGGSSTDKDNIIDAAFSMVPYGSSVKDASADTYYDLIIGSDTTVEFKLYERPYNPDGEQKSAWVPVDTTRNNDTFLISYTSGTASAPIEWYGASYNSSTGKTMLNYPRLVDIKEGYEYAIHIESVRNEPDRNKWNDTINLSIYCVTGSASNLNNLVSRPLTDANFNHDIEAGSITSIGEPSPYPREIRLANQSAPQFSATYPRANPGDSVTTIQYQLDRTATLFWVVSPADQLTPYRTTANDPTKTEILPDAEIVNIGDLKNSDLNTDLPAGERNMSIVTPNAEQIINPSTYYSIADGYRYGSTNYTLGGGLSSFPVQELEANKAYYIFFVLRGSFNEPSPVMCYKFSTADVKSPVLEARAIGTDDAYYTVSSSTGSTMTVDTNWVLYQHVKNAYPSLLDATLVGGSSNGKKVYQAMQSSAFDNHIGQVQLQTGESMEINEFKTLLMEEIQGGYEGIPNADGGTRPVDVGSSPVRVDNFITGLEPGPNYILVVMARNHQGGTPVFRAVTGLHYTDLAAPLIDSISYTTERDVTSIPKVYTGDFLVTFDKSLWVLDANDQTTVYAYKAQASDASTSSSGAGAWLTQASGSSRSFTVHVSNLPIGGVVTIIPTHSRYDVDSRFYSEQGYPRAGEGLSLRLQPEIDQDNHMIIWKLVIQGGDFDGQTSETNPTN